MECKTHIMAANAISLALLMPTSIKYLVLGLSATTIGSVISDIDVSTSESHKDLDKIIFISFFCLVACICLELVFDIGILTYLKKHTELSNIFVGFVLILAVCFYGLHKPHRTFMHSLLCLFILSLIVNFMFKELAIYFFIGMLSHILLDLFNHKKIQILFPFKKKLGFNLCSSNGIVNNVLLSIGTLATAAQLFIFIYNYII